MSTLDPSPDKPVEPTSADKATGAWGAILTTSPIVLAILATAFAGLSSSEMTQAMYYRSLAAQHQSKAGDQWGFFQAKRIRGTSLEMTSELLKSLAKTAPFDPVEFKSLSGKLLSSMEEYNKITVGEKADAARLKSAIDALTSALDNPSTKQNLPHLLGAELPKIENQAIPDGEAKEILNGVVKAIGNRKTEAETADQIRKLSPATIEVATRLAEQNADTFDKACDPVNDTIKQCRAAIASLREAIRRLPVLATDKREENLLQALDGEENGFRLAVLEYDARRYLQESVFNRRTAELYEVRVRRSGIESDRHRERSKMFFYSMLVAQLGVTVSSLALARQQRKALWFFAAFAGLVALVFSGYVYISL